MPTVAEASLRPEERGALERFVELARRDLGGELRSVWLYGSRARGEPPAEESDVDLIVVTRGGWSDLPRLLSLMDEAAEAEGAKSAFFSIHVYTPEHIAQRRKIHSFFIEEVDHDKIVLAGEP